MNAEDHVRAALELAGFPATEEEISIIAASYPAVRQMVGLLGPVLDGSDEIPALGFDPRPRSEA